METRRLGKTDMEVSILGFGGAEIGLEGPGASLKTVTRLLNSALDEGLNLIDTGECYGASEELIGRAVSGRRRDYFLFTKCGHPGGMPREDWRPDSLLGSIQRSLRRLRTDCLDLIQLHTCSEDELIRGTVIETLQRGPRAGLLPLHRLQRRQPGSPLRGAMPGVRLPADFHQHRRSGSAGPGASPGP